MPSLKSMFSCCIRPTSHLDGTIVTAGDMQIVDTTGMATSSNKNKSNTATNTESKVEKKLFSLRKTKSMYKALKNYKIYNNSIGRGTFAVVYKATRVKDGQTVALKFINRLVLDEANQPAKFIHREINILKTLKHDNVIKLHEALDTPNNIIIVTDFAYGGQLLDAIYKIPGFCEKDGQSITKQVLLGLDYLHSNNIVHRDIKPENVLLMKPLTTWCDVQIKIADFGFATILNSGTGINSLTTACGTPMYAAPEILLGNGYGKAVDLWSLGIMLYFLMSGYTPFQSSDLNSLIEVIELAQLTFLHEDFDDVSYLVKDLISKLLIPVPSQRLTAKQTLEHDWFKADLDNLSVSGELDSYNLSHNLQPKLIRNKDTTKLMRHAVAKLKAVSAFSKAISLANLAKDVNYTHTKSNSNTSTSQPILKPPSLYHLNYSLPNDSANSILSSGSQLELDASF